MFSPLPARREDRRRLVAAAVTVIIVVTLAELLRHRLIEPEQVAFRCTGEAAPAWCALREGALAGVHYHVYGGFSILAAAAAVILRRSSSAWLAWAALAAGLTGLVLYNAEVSAVGTVLALVALARVPSQA